MKATVKTMTGQIEKIMKAIPEAARITHTPLDLPLDTKDGALVMRGTDIEGDCVFTMAYRDEYGVRGITGFRHGGTTFNFDRYGIGDSWYPLDWNGKLKKPAELAADVAEQLAEAERRYKALVARKRDGQVIDFGPTKRTLLKSEIESYKAALRERKSFSLNPSGFGTGYRFYLGQVRNRYGQAVQASAEARAIFGERLVYDTTDHD